MNKGIFRALAALAIGVGLILVGAQANADTWRMSHKMPPGSVEGKLFQIFADRVDQYTNGKLKIQVFPAEQLGKDDTVLEQLQIGTINVYPEGGSYLQKWVPDVKWMSAPFLFDNRDHWSRFLHTPLYKSWIKQLEDKAGITVIGDESKFVRGPYRVMVAKKPVHSLQDIQGLKLRMHPDQLASAAWRHLGAEVRVLAWTDVYESISRGIVQAVNSPIALVEPMRFYEVAPHIIRHNEYPQGIAFMANAKAYHGLDDTTRNEVLKAYDDTAQESQQIMADAAAKVLRDMKAKNVTYEEIDTQPFVKRMASFYKEAEEKGDMPKGFMDAVNSARTGG
jgi:TRAP-type C4-dicarboxylate transport system substrate-binding protein